MSFSLEGHTILTEDSEECDPIQEIEVGDVSSFRDIMFQSEEMKNLLRLEEYTDDDKYSAKVAYSADHMFPAWILENAEWLSTEGKNRENKISEVLQTPFNQRTQEQTSTLIHWLMSVWETANLMGFKRCGAMTKVFHFLTYEPGENIITEGERGLTFYIVISGDCNVFKEGIGKVAALTKGQSFGEIALTQGKDLRSATVQAVTQVEVLRLHKVDYDHFVKDIQLAERRENLQVLRSCKLFEQWSRAKIQKMVTTCLRKSYNAGDIIFHQGDPPDNIYFVVEGTVTIVKEIHIVVRNRWPVGISEWDGVAKKKIKPVVVNQLTRGAYFGELSIIKNKNRTATARAKTRCVLLSLDKLEFVHLLRSGKTMETVSHFVTDYQDDVDILNTVADLKGGPSTTAQLNEYVKTAEISARPGSSKRSSIRASTMQIMTPTNQTSRTNKRPTGILRIPTREFEKIGPNNGLPETVKSNTPARRSRISPIKEAVNKKGTDGDAGATSTEPTATASEDESNLRKKHPPPLRTVTKTIIGLNDLNQTSMSSVTRFRKQLNLASNAVRDNSEDPLSSIPTQSVGVVRVDAHIAKRDSKQNKHETKTISVSKIEPCGSAEHLRNMMEGIITGTRKLQYLDDNSALKHYSALSARDLDMHHKRLQFNSEPGSAPAHLGRQGSAGSLEGEAFPTGSTKFQLKLDLFQKPKKSKSRVSTAPTRAPNPQLKFTTSESQPVLLTVNKVVMESSTGRKSRSDNVFDVVEFVEASKRGERPPSREIFRRSDSKDRLLTRSPPQSPSPTRLTSSARGEREHLGGREQLYSRQSSAREPLSRMASDNIL